MTKRKSEKHFGLVFATQVFTFISNTNEPNKLMKNYKFTGVSKVVFTMVLILSNTLIFGQIQKDIKSRITRVIVFPMGAQLENEASFDVIPGKMQLSFKGLSPYINKESIRIDGDGNFTILNVLFQTDYLNQLEKSKAQNDLNESIKQYQNMVEDENTWIKILSEKIEFLKSNKTVTGKEQALSPEVFKSLSSIYGDNFEKYSLEILKRQRLIASYNKELEKLNNQLLALNSEKDIPSGTITVIIDSKKTLTSHIAISYLVDNAGWYPSYDIRFMDVTKPLSISFKANINQNTGVDWKDVELILSTARTNISAQIPELTVNYLQFYSQTYKGNSGFISSPALSNSISMPSQSQVQIRGIGKLDDSTPLYVVDGVPQSDISSISPENIDKIEVLKDASATAIYGARGSSGVILVTTKKFKDESGTPLTVTSKNETSNEFAVEAKQTINSDNKLNTITFKETSLISTFEYQSIPKLSKHAYLVGKVSDWSKADLMDGESNIYLENSFVGKSAVNTQQYSDTLDISFGVDNNIMVNREKIKDFSESQFIGSNKKETYAWKLTVKNNKSYPVRMKLWDQVPISSTKEIQVEALELSGGTMNSNTGKVKWILDLKPNETRQIILKYSVKYPEDKTVLVD